MLKLLTTTLDEAAVEQAQAHADSVKTAIANFSQELVKDPNTVLTNLLETAIGFGLKVLAAILIYLVGAWLIKKVKRLLDSMFIKRGTEKTLATFVKSFVSITLTIFLVIITVSTLGINTTSLAALLAAGGMAIGMALSGTMQNFAGGILILVFKPFKAGDYIKAQGYEGTVLEVNIASTKLKCYDNSIIVVPNGALFNGNIDNFSEKPQHRCKWEVDVAYGTDADRTREVLLGIVEANPDVLRGVEGIPEPTVYLNDLKSSSVQFVLFAWVNTEDYWKVLYAVREEIYRKLPENGIQFPFPQMDIHLDDRRKS